jgi:non-homologous end joining protein Ku
LLLEILRYADELRAPEPYFEKLSAEPAADAVQMAAELIKRHVGRFEPAKMPNEYARAVQKLVRPKVEQRAPSVELAEAQPTAKVINIMAALKESIEARQDEGARRGAPAHGEGDAQASGRALQAAGQGPAGMGRSLISAPRPSR